MANGKHTFAKVLGHPDIDQVITRLTTGESVRAVTVWLKNKYPKNKLYQLSHATLENFRRDYLNLHGSKLADIKKATIELTEYELKQKMSLELTKIKTYDDHKKDLLDPDVDYKKLLARFVNVAETRMGQIFNITQINPSDLRPDKRFLEYMEGIVKLIELIKKMEGVPDQVIHHNFTIQAIDEQAAIFQEAFLQTAAELDFHSSSILIDKYMANLEKLKAKRLGNDSYTKADINRLEKLVARVEEEEKAIEAEVVSTDDDSDEPDE